MHLRHEIKTELSIRFRALANFQMLLRLRRRRGLTFSLQERSLRIGKEDGCLSSKDAALMVDYADLQHMETSSRATS